MIIDQIISSGSSLNEISRNEDLENLCKAREELIRFMNNLNLSGLSDSLTDQIHYLYVALIHVENAEKEIMGSFISEEILTQNKIIEDLHCLKLMVLEFIKELSSQVINDPVKKTFVQYEKINITTG